MKSSAGHGSEPVSGPLVRLFAERRPAILDGAMGEEDDTGFRREAGPERYAEFARRWARSGVAFIGGCCGTTPEYIRALTGGVR